MRVRWIVLAAALPAAVGAQGAAPKLDTLMTAREYREAGIAKLSAAERASLERWLGRRMQRPAAARPAPTAHGATPPAARPGAVVSVTSVLGGGGFVVLADGTMWEVWVSDQPASATWRAGDALLVRAQPAPPEERYTLRFENGRTRSVASVRYAGVAQPSAVAIGRGPTAAPAAPAAPAYPAQTVIVREPVYVPVPAYDHYPHYPAHPRARRPAWPEDDRHRQPPPSSVGVRRPAPTLPAPPTMAPPPTISPAPRP